MLNVAGRFKVLDQPMASPNKCAFCGLGHNQDGTVSFVDTTLDLDFFGVVYICSNCLTEISVSLGYIPPESWQHIVDDSTNTLIENEKLKAENDALRDMVTNLVTHRCYRNPSPAPAIEAPSGIEDDGLANGALKGIESDEPKPDASSGESGLSDVRRTTEFNDGDAIAKSVERRRKSKDDPLAEFDL